MIDPRILRTFVAVVDHRSVIGAARGCVYSAGAVSRQISALQNQLGARLFEPEGRGIRPTPVAMHLASAARELLDASDRFDSYARALCEGRASVPSIAAHQSSAADDNSAAFADPENQDDDS